MSSGVYPQLVPCSFCHKTVFDVDALWSEGLPFHDNCWKFHLANELKKYQRKVDLGTITIAEASLMSRLQEDYDIAKKSPASVPVSILINSDKPRFKGNSSLALASIERKQRYISSGKDAKVLGGSTDPKNPRFLVAEDHNAETSQKR